MYSHAYPKVVEAQFESPVSWAKNKQIHPESSQQFKDILGNMFICFLGKSWIRIIKQKLLPTADKLSFVKP